MTENTVDTRLRREIIYARNSMIDNDDEVNYRIHFLPLGKYVATIENFGLKPRSGGVEDKGYISMTLSIAQGNFSGLKISIAYSLNKAIVTMIKLESLFRLCGRTISIGPDCGVEEFVEHLNTEMKGTVLDVECFKYHAKKPLINILHAQHFSAPTTSEVDLDEPAAWPVDVVPFIESDWEQADELNPYEGTQDLDSYEYVQSTYEFSGPEV